MSGLTSSDEIDRRLVTERVPDPDGTLTAAGTGRHPDRLHHLARTARYRRNPAHRVTVENRHSGASGADIAKRADFTLGPPATTLGDIRPRRAQPAGNRHAPRAHRATSIIALWGTPDRSAYWRSTITNSPGWAWPGWSRTVPGSRSWVPPVVPVRPWRWSSGPRRRWRRWVPSFPISTGWSWPGSFATGTPTWV